MQWEFCYYLQQFNKNSLPINRTIQIDQATWGGVCNTGAEQSPINLELKPFQPRLAVPTKFKLNKHYDTERVHRFFAQNNGHTGMTHFVKKTKLSCNQDFSCLNLKYY